MAIRRDTIMFMFYSIITIGFIFLAGDAAASSATPGVGMGLPWEGPLDKLSNSIAGPFAFAASLIGLVVAGAVLIWGGEIGTFFKTLFYLILVVSLIVFARNLLSGVLFTGAVIPLGI